MIDIHFTICNVYILVPDFCTMGTEYFLWYCGRTVMLNTNLLLVPVCEWVGVVPPSPLCASTGMSRGDYFCLHTFVQKKSESSRNINFFL